MREILNDNRNGLISAGIVLASALALASCASGQQNPPTPDEFNRDRHIVVLDDVTTNNGDPVICVMYGRGTKDTQMSKSWFGFACDFEGSAQFPFEIAPKTTTTTQG